MKKRVLFLCTANAARSQMAEAIAKSRHGDVIDAVSAGSRPAGRIHPDAVRAMAELGVDIHDAQPKAAEPFLNERFDVVVTVCDGAAKDCPRWPGAARVEHWSIEDPAYVREPSARYRRFIETRDDLARRIDKLVRELR